MRERIVHVRHTRLGATRAVPPSSAVGHATPLADVPLFIHQETRVVVGDQVFVLDDQGLYQFWDDGVVEWSTPDAPPKCVEASAARYRAVIVWQQDLLPFLGALAAIQLHGFADNDLNDGQLVEKARHDLLRISCGRTARFVCTLLERHGIPARLVQGLKMVGRFDGRDDGHVLFEFHTGDRWVLVDVDMRVVFLDPEGQPMDLMQFWLGLRTGEPFDFYSLCPAGVGLVDTQNTGTAARMGPLFEDGAKLTEWYQQVLQLPLIEDDDGYSYCPADDEASVARVTAYAVGYRCLPPREWAERFYDIVDG